MKERLHNISFCSNHFVYIDLVFSIALSILSLKLNEKLVITYGKSIIMNKCILYINESDGITQKKIIFGLTFLLFSIQFQHHRTILSNVIFAIEAYVQQCFRNSRCVVISILLTYFKVMLEIPVSISKSDFEISYAYKNQIWQSSSAYL